MKYSGTDVLDEFDAAIATYERQRLGRGDRFRAAVLALFERVEETPLLFPRDPRFIRPTVRKARVPHFPYAVFFYVSHGEVIVVAIAHGRRHPGYWAKRLD